MRPDQHHNDDVRLKIACHMIKPCAVIEVFKEAIREQAHELRADQEEDHAEKRKQRCCEQVFRSTKSKVSPI